VGLPETIQSNEDPIICSFTSAIYASIKLNTKQFKSNESRGDLKRVHQTLKKI
jgi:hypothetical protein